MFNDILLTTFEQVEEIAGSLRVELNREKDLLRIVEKANMALSRISDQIYEGQGIQDSKKSLPGFESFDISKDSTANTLQAVAHEIRNPLS